MSDRHDEKIETMLRSRPLEPARPDLAERIILKAQTMPQIEVMPLTHGVRRIFAEFHLPQPGYILSCALVAGFLIGVMTPADMPTEHPELGVQSFLYADEDIL